MDYWISFIVHSLRCVGRSMFEEEGKDDKDTMVNEEGNGQLDFIDRTQSEVHRLEHARGRGQG